MRKNNGQILSYGGKTSILGNFGHFCPIFGAKGAKKIFFSKIQECHFFSFMKRYFHAKFQKISMDGCGDTALRTDGRTDARTDGRTNSAKNIAPPQNNRGTN